MITYHFNNNTDDKGRHEVHTRTCTYLPKLENRTQIGIYSTCNEAIAKAKSDYPWREFDGCFYCCNPCHKG